jgi:hypothetical protein
MVCEKFPSQMMMPMLKSPRNLSFGFFKSNASKMLKQFTNEHPTTRRISPRLPKVRMAGFLKRH